MVLNSLQKLLGTAGRQRLSILIYHRVMPEADFMRPGDPSARQFQKQMQVIAKYFTPLSIDEALRRMLEGDLPQRAVCVTFDDGYADNARIAFPILKRWRVPAAIFVSTNYIDGGIMWNDTVIEAIRTSPNKELDLNDLGLGRFLLGNQDERRNLAHSLLVKIKYLNTTKRREATERISALSKNLPQDLMLTADELKLLSGDGIEIGGHTHTHPILRTLSYEEARTEITLNRTLLENIIGKKVRYFAYPNGKHGKDYDLEHRDMVRDCGFEAAFSTTWGVSDKSTDMWQLPRFTPWDVNSNMFTIRLLLNERNLV